MRIELGVCLVLLAGCDRLFGLQHVVGPDAEPERIDGTVGTLVDAGPCVSPAASYGRTGPGGEGLLELCLVPVAGTLMLPATINTDADCTFVLEQEVGGTGLCVIHAGMISVEAAMRATGSRPLVLVASMSIEISAPLDVATYGPGNVGAGGGWSGCGTSNGVTNGGGGSGGAGGSFGTAGGSGGKGTFGGGVADPAAPPNRVRGGCHGSRGGDADMPGGGGGRGGGALYMIAGTMLQLGSAARINASGDGGRGGHYNNIVNLGGAGGGGGGSGGLIGLAAPSIVVDAAASLIANGGGGGGGGGATSGTNGSQPNPAMVMMPASGGAGGNGGGSGGSGAAGTTAALPGGTNKSGGGGGGGVGVIKIYTAIPPSMPTASSPPWQSN